MPLPASLVKVVSVECLCCLEHLQILIIDAYCCPSCLSNTCYALQSTLTSESFATSFEAGSILLML